MSNDKELLAELLHIMKEARDEQRRFTPIILFLLGILGMSMAILSTVIIFLLLRVI